MNKLNLSKIIKYSSYLIPLSLLSGPFIPDFLMTISIVYFIIILLKKKKITFPINKFLFIFFIFYISIFISTVFSPNPLISAESTIPYFRLILFCLVISHFYEDDENFLKNYKFFFILPIIFIFIDSFLQLIFGFNILLYEYDGEVLTGIFKDEKILGSYILRILPIMIALILLDQNNLTQSIKNKLLIVLILILANIIIYFSDERAALFNFFLFCALLLYFNIFGLRRIIILCFSIVIILFILFNNILENKILNKTLKYSGYDSGNIFIFSDHHHLHYLTAFKIFRDNIIFGAGPKQFRNLCKDDRYLTTSSDIYDTEFISKLSTLDKQRLSDLDGCSTHPHHTYMQLLSETGIIGFLIFFIVYLKLFLMMFKITKDSKNYNTKMILIFIILINFSPLMPSGNFFNNYLSLIYFIPISILYALIIKEKNVKFN